MTTQTLETVNLTDIAEADKNVRRTATVGREFLASIKQHGILQPPVGWRDKAGVVHITMGQRRTLAARKLGLTSIPVIIAGSQEEAEATRIVTQLAENDQREALPDADHVEAFRQLAFDLGLSTTEIAKRTNVPKARVQTAVDVAESQKASDALKAYNLTLDDAAVFLEFQDDQDSIIMLIKVIENDPGRFAHQAQLLRNERETRAKVAVIEAEAVALGLKMADPDDYSLLRLSDLWWAGDAQQVKLTAKDVPHLKNVLARVDTVWVGDERQYTLGFRISEADARAQGLGSYRFSQAKEELSEAEKEAERAERARRKEVRAAWSAASTVRREWIQKTLLARAIAFKDAAEWLALLVIGAEVSRPYASDHKITTLAATWLGIEFEQPKNSWETPQVEEPLIALIRGRGSVSALNVMVAFAVARAEVDGGDEKASDYGDRFALAPYLKQLQAWGYTLSDVEQAIVDKATQ